MPHRLFALFLATAVFAADAPKGKATAQPKAPEPPTYLTVETAGQDFSLQGEYSSGKIGANVIALGEGNFRLVLFQGGLPGDGWDRSPKTEFAGRRTGEVVSFEGVPETRLTKDGLALTMPDQGRTSILKRIVRHSPTEGLAAPQNAIVLFDGKNAEAWVDGKVDERGLLAANTKTKQAFRSFRLHIEFLLPFKPLGRGQSRANSGVYLQHRYEVQVLDSFGLKGLDNECGGIYKNSAPSVNMCYPPLQWQTYDVDFTAAEFDADGKKTADAVVTVTHNGVIVQDKLALRGATPGGAFKTEVPAPGPIYLQGHGNPVFYRNIWVVEK